MRKKIDWNSYIGKKNKFGVKICDWEEQKEKHTREDKVVCICPECNRYFIASAIRIVVEETRYQTQGCIACGYKRSASKRSKDYSSYFNKPNKYGIVILRWVENKSIHTNQDKVVCICPDCKKEFVSTLTNLIYEKNKQVKRCINCAARLNGEAFMKKNKLEPGSMWGFAKALYPGEPYVNTHGYRTSTTVCECILCGKIFTAKNINLKKCKTKSCGCLKSYLEQKTSECLVSNKIHFTHGLRFPAILTDNGNPVEFDFQIKDEHNNHIAFIECQGEQHYADSHGNFGRQQREETDIKKKNYCKEHNLNLYEIRFDDDVEQRVNEILTELKLI